MREQKIIFLNTIKALDDLSYLTYYLKYQLAPVIMGVKPSIILTLGKSKNHKISKIKTLKIIDSLGLKGIILRENEGSHIVLAYRKCSLEELRENEEACRVLKEIGYPLDSTYKMLAYLRKRYAQCHCPPELGIFLGFPVDDVEDYMCQKKKCLLCGYWQVYNDVEAAKEIFYKYDDAKNSMLIQLLNELKCTS